MAKKDVKPDTTFKEWYTMPGSGGVGLGAKSALKLLGKTEDGSDTIWKFHDDVFTVPYGETGAVEPRELVVFYAVYRRAVLRLGGEPSEYERPVKEWSI